VRREAQLEWIATVVISGVGGVLVFLLVDDFPLWKTILGGVFYGVFVGTGLTIMHRFGSRSTKPPSTS
jgi:hypothetical protein